MSSCCLELETKVRKVFTITNQFRFLKPHIGYDLCVGIPISHLFGVYLAWCENIAKVRCKLWCCFSPARKIVPCFVRVDVLRLLWYSLCSAAAAGWGRLQPPLLLLPRILNHPSPRTFHRGINSIFELKVAKRFLKIAFLLDSNFCWFWAIFTVHIVCWKKPNPPF